MKIKTGMKAPEFSLYSSEKEIVNLSDFKGSNLLILFFPAAFSGTCTDEMCTVRDGLSEYKNSGSEIIGISCDSPFTLAKFKELNKIPFTLLSDYNKVVCADYDCQFDEFVHGMKGNAKRAAFIIDGDGIVQYIEVTAKASDLPDFDQISKKLNALKASQV